MPGVLTLNGRLRQAGWWKGEAPAAGQDWRIHLVAADFVPGPLTELGAVTVAGFAGYEALSINPDMGAGPFDEGGDAVVTLGGGPLVWTCTGSPQTIYGWVLHDHDTDQTLACDRYTTPQVLAIGATHTLTAKIAIGQC